MPRDVGGIKARIEKILHSKNISFSFIQEDFDENCDFVLVVGKDGDVLSLFLKYPDMKKPVLGISLSDRPGFLTDIPINQFNDAINKIMEGKFLIQEFLRINVLTDDFSAYALNEVALFSSKSATLIEYELWIDKEFVWRDYSDGVIVATSVGSTAYAMSAGGVFISPKANVFEIVPVNSVDVSRRPIIIPSDSIIEIKHVAGRFTPEIVIDGSIRRKVRGDILMTKAKNTAKFIKIHDTELIRDRIIKKVEQSKDILDLPPSAKFVLKVLEYEGTLSQTDIIRKTLLPPRTVRYALSLLLRKGLIKEKELLGRDARRKIYYIPEIE